MKAMSSFNQASLIVCFGLIVTAFQVLAKHAALEGALVSGQQSNDFPSFSSKDDRGCWKFQRCRGTIDPPFPPPSVLAPPPPPPYSRGCSKAQRCRGSPPKRD